MAPENRTAFETKVDSTSASMRPGLDGPGKLDARPPNIAGSVSFNEAGAGWPRKTFCMVSPPDYSMWLQ